MTKKNFIVLFVMVFVLLGCFSKGRVKTAPTPAPTQTTPQETYFYYYYPNSYVYYDLKNKIYFYMSNGNWVSVSSLPQGFHLSDNYTLTIEMKSLQPFSEHEMHKKKYPPRIDYDDINENGNMNSRNEGEKKNKNHD